jgi:hypothetical protein
MDDLGGGGYSRSAAANGRVQMIDFQQWLNQQGDGRVLIELNDTMAKLVKDCIDTGKVIEGNLGQ